MSRPRDTQRSRLYAAEGHWTGHSKAAERLLINGKRVKSTGSVSIEACQRYVDDLVQRAWFRRRFGDVAIGVTHKAYGTATGYRTRSGVWTKGPWVRGRIVMPPWSRTEPIILHEVAHVLTPNDLASHGPEFAGVYVELVRYAVGAEAARSQRESFREARIRFNRRALPN